MMGVGGKSYRVFVTDYNYFDSLLDQEITERIIDEQTQEQFEATVTVSSEARKDYFPLNLEGEQRSSKVISGKYFVRVLQRLDEEEEEITFFAGGRMGQRRGYMLKSSLEERTQAKRNIMTKDLEDRARKKEKLVNELRKDK